jgi:hypothetical protein
MSRSPVGVSLLAANLFLQTGNVQKPNAVDEWKELQCTGTRVTGRYENYAEGFSVLLPRGLTGRVRPAENPQRGFSIPLSPACEAVIVVYGSPNALEWTSPEDAITWEIQVAKQGDHAVAVTHYAAQLGRLRGAGVTLRSDRTSHIDDLVVAFRPESDRIYSARLSTTAARYRQDRNTFLRILRLFRLEPRRVVPALSNTGFQPVASSNVEAWLLNTR